MAETKVAENNFSISIINAGVHFYKCEKCKKTLFSAKYPICQDCFNELTITNDFQLDRFFKIKQEEAKKLFYTYFFRKLDSKHTSIIGDSVYVYYWFTVICKISRDNGNFLICLNRKAKPSFAIEWFFFK